MEKKIVLETNNLLGTYLTSLVFPWRPVEFTVWNVEIAPALFRVNIPPKEILLLKPKVKYLYLILILKERHRIGKKHKSWRSQIYIKITRPNDGDSRKHPLQWHIWWEINNQVSRCNLKVLKNYLQLCLRRWVSKWKYIDFICVRLLCYMYLHAT